MYISNDRVLIKTYNLACYYMCVSVVDLGYLRFMSDIAHRSLFSYLSSLAIFGDEPFS